MRKSSLTDNVERWIESQPFESGDRLPSIRKLCDRFAVGRTAMGNVVNVLIQRGLLEQRGKGFYKAQKEQVPGTPDDDKPVVDVFAHRHIPHSVIRHFHHEGFRVRVKIFTDESEVRGALYLALEEGSAGVLMRKCTEEPLLRRLEDKGIPVVVYGQRREKYSFVAASMLKLADRAVDHLSESGHREIAYLGLPEGLDYLENRKELIAVLPETYRKHGLEPSRQHHLVLNGEGRPEVLSALREIHSRFPGVTALICETFAIGMHAVQLAERCGWNVPGDLSILCLQDHQTAIHAEPPLTTLGVEMDQMLQLAATLLISEIQNRKAHPLSRRTTAVSCEPELIQRGSTGKGPHSAMAPEASEASGKGPGPDLPWALNARERHRQVRRMNQRCLPFPRAAHPVFDPLPLPLKNGRTIARQNAWLGKDPLRFFPGGNYVIHGVPYQVENRALIPASAMARRAHGQPLPEEFCIPVDRSLNGICFLHAAGWVVYGEPFAEYEFRFANHGPVIVPVTPFPDKEHRGPKAQPANVKSPVLQDWHPSFRQNQGKNVLPYVVTEKGDPLLYERYLYSYRWQNPYPDEEVTGILMRGLNTERRATLALLAVTTYQ